MERLENKNGITLVALVITVIILLILAGIAISMIFREEGLFAKANHAGDVYTKEATNEEARYSELNDYLALYSGDEISDLMKLREYFKKGWNVISQNDYTPYMGEFNNIPPIMDASTSLVWISDFYADGVYFDFYEYNGNKYKVNENTMDVIQCTEEEKLWLLIVDNGEWVADNDNESLFFYNNNLYVLNDCNARIIEGVNLTSFGEVNIEGWGNILITPSTPDNLIHANYQIGNWLDPETNEHIQAYIVVIDETDDIICQWYYDFINGNYLGEMLLGKIHSH